MIGRRNRIVRINYREYESQGEAGIARLQKPKMSRPQAKAPAPPGVRVSKIEEALAAGTWEAVRRSRTMDTKKLRAWWFHRQGLDGRYRGESASKVLGETGWARSVGGASPYLTLFSRGRVSREAADAAVAGLEIHELPAARGCTYVLPACDFAFALKAGAGFADSDMRVASKLGVTDKEVGKLCDAVVKALAKGAMDPEEIRQATGD